MGTIPCPGSFSDKGQFCDTLHPNDLMASWRAMRDRIDTVQVCEGDDCEKTITLTLVDEGKDCIDNGTTGEPRRGRLRSFEFTVFCLAKSKKKKFGLKQNIHVPVDKSAKKSKKKSSKKSSKKSKTKKRR